MSVKEKLAQIKAKFKSVIDRIRSFFSNLIGGIASAKRAVIDRARRLHATLKGLWTRARDGILAYVLALDQNPKTRFLTVAWSFCIIFVAVSSLSSSNPLSLLAPGLAFPFPVTDQRQSVELLGISSAEQKVLPVTRKMLIGPSVEANVQKIALLVSQPLGFTELSAVKYSDLKPLPMLGLAVRKVWFLKETGHLVIDMRSRTLQEEFERFVKERSAAGNPYHYLDGYFMALTGSVFQVQKEVRSISYLLDGKSGAWREMEFDLSLTRTRETK